MGLFGRSIRSLTRSVKASGLRFRAYTWRVGGLSNWLFEGLISTITPIRVPFRVLISLLTTYLLSPPTLQVGFVEGLGVQSALENFAVATMALLAGVSYHVDRDV